MEKSVIGWVVLSLFVVFSVLLIGQVSDLWGLVVILGWAGYRFNRPTRTKGLMLTAGLMVVMGLGLFWLGMGERSMRAASWVFWIWLVELGCLVWDRRKLG